MFEIVGFVIAIIIGVCLISFSSALALCVIFWQNKLSRSEWPLIVPFLGGLAIIYFSFKYCPFEVRLKE